MCQITSLLGTKSSTSPRLTQKESHSLYGGLQGSAQLSTHTPPSTHPSSLEGGHFSVSDKSLMPGGSCSGWGAYQRCSHTGSTLTNWSYCQLLIPLFCIRTFVPVAPSAWVSHKAWLGSIVHDIFSVKRHLYNLHSCLALSIYFSTLWGQRCLPFYFLLLFPNIQVCLAYTWSSVKNLWNEKNKWQVQKVR